MRWSFKHYSIYPLILLLVLAGLTLWVNFSVQDNISNPDRLKRHAPDYVIKNFVSYTTNREGYLSNQLQANEMRHFPDDDSTWIVNPRYIQFIQNGPTTEVHSDKGQLSSEGEQVAFIGNVRMTRFAYAEQTELTLETDLLYVQPQSEIMHTTRPVLVRQAPHTVIRAQGGMVYEKEKKLIQLMRNVRVRYE